MRWELSNFSRDLRSSAIDDYSVEQKYAGQKIYGSGFSPPQYTLFRQNFQVHVMNEYARRALDKIGAAMRLVASYFNDDKEEFIQRFFPDGKKMFAYATSAQSYAGIVDDLKNTSQQHIVSAGLEANMLVLAGPGAGKTRVVTHRVAYLVRVLRVKPKSILVLCFNRSAVMSLRRRLHDLIGDEAHGITTLTFMAWLCV